jgi:hypothetical protein
MTQTTQPVPATPLPNSTREHPDNDRLTHGNEERVHAHPQSRRSAGARRVVRQPSARAGW